tara:strand:+ start:88 stop:498 length:411 start_codon:yes stop_codon:yes gene_type:complete
MGNPFESFMQPNFQNMVGQEFLESTPQAAYSASPMGSSFMQRPQSPGQTTSMQDPTRKRFYQNNFQTFYDDYLSKLGTQAYGTTNEDGQRQYGIPTMNFRDYLAEDPFTEKYAALTPQQKGIYSQDYNPRTRTLFY